MAKKFGISKDQQGTNTVSIPAPIKLKEANPRYKTGYEFPVATLVNVHFDPAKEMTISGVKEERPILSFTFVDEKKRTFTHLEFPIDDTDNRFNDKMDWMNQRIRHIWDEVIGSSKFPESGIGENAESFADFFKEVADLFKSIKVGEGEAAKPLYTLNPVYMKLTYNTKNKLQFPLFPNFLQRAKVGDKILPVENLAIDISRDKVEQTVTKTASTYTGGTDNPFGGSEDSFGSDFPDVL